jgi:hypothetical protein
LWSFLSLVHTQQTSFGLKRQANGGRFKIPDKWRQEFDLQQYTFPAPFTQYKNKISRQSAASVYGRKLSFMLLDMVLPCIHCGACEGGMDGAGFYDVSLLDISLDMASAL